MKNKLEVSKFNLIFDIESLCWFRNIHSGGPWAWDRWHREDIPLVEWDLSLINRVLDKLGASRIKREDYCLISDKRDIDKAIILNECRKIDNENISKFLGLYEKSKIEYFSSIHECSSKDSNFKKRYKRGSENLASTFSKLKQSGKNIYVVGLEKKTVIESILKSLNVSHYVSDVLSCADSKWPFPYCDIYREVIDKKKLMPDSVLIITKDSSLPFDNGTSSEVAARSSGLSYIKVFNSEDISSSYLDWSIDFSFLKKTRERKIFYHHAMKCAGTSILLQMRLFFNFQLGYGRNKIYYDGHIEHRYPRVSPLVIDKRYPEEGVLFYACHESYSPLHFIKDNSSDFWFTIIRNPVDVFYSYFNYVSVEKGWHKPWDCSSIEELIDKILDEEIPYSEPPMKPEDFYSLDSFDFVGIAENMKKTCEFLNKELGISISYDRAENKAKNYATSKLYRIEELKKYLAEPIKQYDLYKKKLESVLI